jgi:cell division initiation protein
MRITPLDIRKQEFRKAMRGLDSEEVHAFLTTVAEEYEAALSDNKALRERVLELDDKVQEYRSMERTLRDTLLTAERVTADAKENARREADLIIKEAQIEAEKVLRDIKNQAMKLRQEVQELRRERDNYLARMKMLAESYLKFIEEEDREFERSDRSAPPTLEDEARRRAAGRKSAPSGSPKPETYRSETFRTERAARPEPPPETGLEDRDGFELPDLPAEKPAGRDRVPSQPATMTAKDRSTPLPAMTPAETEPDSAAPATPEAESDGDDRPLSSLPDLNAILDRMVASQEEMFRSTDSGDSLADPPDAEETNSEPAEAHEVDHRPQPKPAVQKASAAKVDHSKASPPSPQPSEEWTLDKIKQDMLADYSSSE